MRSTTTDVLANYVKPVIESSISSHPISLESNNNNNNNNRRNSKELENQSNNYTLPENPQSSSSVQNNKSNLSFFDECHQVLNFVDHVDDQNNYNLNNFNEQPQIFNSQILGLHSEASEIVQKSENHTLSYISSHNFTNLAPPSNLIDRSLLKQYRLNESAYQLRKAATSSYSKGNNYGHAEMQGRRSSMEDNYDILEFDNFQFYCLFDGHGTKACSTYAAENLLTSIVKENLISMFPNMSGDRSAKIKDILFQSILRMDELLYNHLSELNQLNSGSTVVILCVDQIQNKIYILNLGDSRGIIFSSSKNQKLEKPKILFSTIDHKPHNEQEKARIEKAGGFVANKRVNGQLAVSRALGDFHLKQFANNSYNGFGSTIDTFTGEGMLVTPIVDISEFEIDQLKAEQENELILVLACDGVYDVMQNDEVASYVSNCLYDANKIKQLDRNKFQQILDYEDLILGISKLKTSYANSINMIENSSSSDIGSASISASSEISGRERSMTDREHLRKMNENEIRLEKYLEENKYNVDDLGQVAKKLILEAFDRGSCDNISAFVIRI